MKTKKAYGLVVAMLAIVLVLGACGGNNNDGNANGNASGNGNANGGNAEVAEGSGEDVTLTLYSWRPEDAEGYATIISEFEAQNPGIKVDFQPYKSSEYNTILNNALLSGSGVDLLQLRPYDAATALADADYLTAVGDLPGIDQLDEQYLNAAKGSDGEVYGVPFMLNNAVIFYNKTMFEENGIEVPQTYEAFVAVCEQLQELGIVPVAQSGKAGYLLSMTHAVLGESAFGSNEFVDAVVAGEAKFTDEAFVNSVQRMKDLEPFFPNDFIAIEDKDAQMMFYNQEAAMYINGSHRLETFKANDLQFDVDFFTGFAPEEGGQSHIVTWVDGSFAVAKTSKHQEEALKFLEFVASDSFGKLFSETLTRVSPVPGVEPADPLLARMKSLSVDNAVPYLILAHFNQGAPASKVAFEDALQGLYLDYLDAAQVAQELQDSVDKWFTPQS
ncbi:extracellular solute-binding protein [Paenibacillus sp. IB182496]|uniref:Extracellular solute-binding protein n=1 Tax=Paenibacillus sabuli TaxID=2772509 RepID=A0A927GSA1_9BACL|nr:extracellular solute-binding protein [Paenibacillus sabuli]MBD2846348.1 extracellular solute-binding protein [Paenibacillus sabuli]